MVSWKARFINDAVTRLPSRPYVGAQWRPNGTYVIASSAATKQSQTFIAVKLVKYGTSHSCILKEVKE